MQDVEILVITEEEVSLPFYATAEAAGADVRAHIPKPLLLEPGQSLLVPTGLRFEIPPGYEVQIRPRSGLALKQGITVLNSPGTIDSDYRGPVNIILINHGKHPIIIEPNMRIAQVVIAPVVQARFVRVDHLAATDRGVSGFGSTGV